MGHESLHIMDSSLQCLQVDDVIPILSPAMYCGRCSSQGFDVVMLCGCRVKICA